MVATAVDSVIKRDPGSGKFVKGNASGKLAKGVPKNGKPILTAQQLRLSEACKAIRDAAPDIVNKLREQALEGDTGAANTLLRYAIPMTSNETTVAGLDDLVGLAPETRIRRINERALAGDLLLEHARVLTDAARQEAEVELLAPMRRLLGEVSAGSITLPEAIDRLAQLHDASVIDQALSNHPLAVTEP